MDKTLSQKEIEDLIDKKIEKFDKQQDYDNDYRLWRRYDSVTDVYSPITGASQMIGFFGTPKISKPTVTGAKGGNAALTSLCSVLASLGLITNSTS